MATVDFKTFDITKTVEEYKKHPNEFDEKVLKEFAESFINIIGYHVEDTLLVPELAIPEGFVAESKPLITATEFEINFRRRKDGSLIRVKAGVKSIQEISAASLKIYCGHPKLDFFSTIYFEVFMGTDGRFFAWKYIKVKNIIDTWNNQQQRYLERHTNAALVDSYFNAEEVKRKCDEKLRERAEKFTNIAEWSFDDNSSYVRAYPLISIPEGYETEDEVRIGEISKDHEIHLVKRDENGNIDEEVKIVVNISGTETIISENLLNATFNVREIPSKTELYFCNSMKFKVVFYGASGQKLRHEFRKVMTKEEMIEIFARRFYK